MTVAKAPTVAVVDDDDAVRDALSNLLSSLGLRVATFDSAEAFLASPAGAEAACLIAAFPREHVRQQAESAGAFGFFAKPFEGGPMIACIERAIHRSTGGN